MTLLIGDNVVVSMHYTLTDADGTVIDSSEGAEPLDYLHGAGNIIPGLESALIGKSEGQEAQVVVQPEDGYGEVVPELIQSVDRSAFEGVDEIEVGMAFHAQSADGQMRQIEVRAIDGDEIIVDGNHPLAGVELHFDVKIVGLRAATEEELAAGQVV